MRTETIQLPGVLAVVLHGVVRTPTTTPPTSPSEVGGRGTDKKKKCRVVAGFRIKSPKIEGDRWTVQARSRSGRWETQITTASKAFALEWVNSRSPNKKLTQDAVSERGT